MTIDVQPTGSIISVPRYVWERPKPGISGAIMRLLGLARAKRRLARVDEIASPFAYALVRGADAEGTLDAFARPGADGQPAILGTPETAASMLDFRDRTPPEELLAETSKFDPDHWLAERLA